MPSHDFDFEMYAVGGCLVEDNQPEIRCRDCGWNGLAPHQQTQNS